MSDLPGTIRDLLSSISRLFFKGPE